MVREKIIGIMNNHTKAMVLPRNTECDNEATRKEKTGTIRRKDRPERTNGFVK